MLSLGAARCTESWQKSISVGKSKLKQVAAPGAKESKYTVPWILRTNGWQHIYSWQVSCGNYYFASAQCSLRMPMVLVPMVSFGVFSCPWCLLVSFGVHGVFWWSGCPGLVAMRRANVKKLKLKKKTSTESFHKAFPDMKSWALRASAGCMRLCFIAFAMHAHFQPKALNGKNTCS